MTDALITRLDVVDPEFEEAFARLLISPAEADPHLIQTVSQILRSVASEGDAALLQLTNELDQRDAPTAASLRVHAEAMEEAVTGIDAKVRSALEQAAERIRVFHERQLASSWQFEDGEGNVLGQRISALDRVGVYVPGGRDR